jgi:hypothetical protein
MIVEFVRQRGLGELIPEFSWIESCDISTQIPEREVGKQLLKRLKDGDTLIIP